MGLNPYDPNVTVAMMEEELAMKQAEDTLVAELRELHRAAALAALSGTAGLFEDGMTNADLRTITGNAIEIADEFVRLYNRDADAPLPAPETRPVKVRFAQSAGMMEFRWIELCRKYGPEDDVAACPWLQDCLCDFANYLAAHAVLPVPAGVPSAQDLRAAFMDYTDSYHRGENDGKMSPTDFALKYLTPWLREPTGWECDISDEECILKMLEIRKSGTSPSSPVFRDFVLSRIRPTFGPCKECAKKEAELRRHNDKWTGFVQRCQADAANARAALEGE